MAYKKYIKRGGKIYGPYIYHSKRVDGKVVSEYKGQSKSFGVNFDSKGFKVLLVILEMAILIGILYAIYNFSGNFTGNVILDSNSTQKTLSNQNSPLNTPSNSQNFPVYDIPPQTFSAGLTDSEKSVLVSKFGNSPVEIKKATVDNGVLTVRYGIGNYWIEFNYDNNLGKNELNSAMKSDITKWLVDLSNQISSSQNSNSASSSQVSSLQGQNFGF